MITVDDSRPGLPVVRFIGELEDDELVAYLDGMNRRIAAGEPYVLVFDGSQAAVPTGRQARILAQWMREVEVPMRKVCCGIVLVIRSVALRGALRTLLYMQPMPVAHVVVAHLDEALRWAELRMETAELDPPT